MAGNAKKILFSLAVFLLLASPAAGQRNEVEWCKVLAPKYKAEVEIVLWDRTRCDLVTATEAIEVDWASKWAEAIGQAQYYAILLRREPAVMLLVKDMEKEARYVYRCQTVCTKLKMRLYVETVSDD